VKPPPFAYARAASVEDALGLLADAGDGAKLLAGGQSLLPLLAFRIARPTHLIDIDGVDSLEGTSRRDDGLVIGALTRHAALERMPLQGGERLLAEAAALIGHVPIRARGTIGGSVAHADPAAELPVALLALDAQVIVRSAAGERTVPAEGFFLGPFLTALAPDEAITAVVVPPESRAARAAFAEFAVRAGDFALASAAVVAWSGDDARVSRARVALGGVDGTPLRAAEAERALGGAELTQEAVLEIAGIAATACEPADDPLVGAAYRRALVRQLVREALERIRGSLPR
jgi:carbon-monoxide dehydrogenase medium subunit/6-hydroxypseudooxynicotine dehydrogenase subunit alpha